MADAFATIQFGPFSTEYHRRAVNGEFRAALFAYLSDKLLPQVDEPFDSTAGTLTAEVNEERFCGPHSLVKDIYKLDFSFIRRGSSDELQAEIRWNAKTASFEPRYRHQHLFLWTSRRKAENRAFHELASRLQGSNETACPELLKCPRCAADLRFTDSATMFDLSCPRGCFCLSYHRDRATGEYRSGHFLSGPPRNWSEDGPG